MDRNKLDGAQYYRYKLAGHLQGYRKVPAISFPMRYTRTSEIQNVSYRYCIVSAILIPPPLVFPFLLTPPVTVSAQIQVSFPFFSLLLLGKQIIKKG